MSFGTRLKEVREKAGFSRQDLADRLEVSYYTVSKYETEERKPDIDTLAKIASIFAVSLDYLLGRTDNPEGLTDEEEQRHIELDEVLSHKKILFYGEPLTLEEKEAIVDVLKIIKQRNKTDKNK